ncbi:hypothetical protein [Sphingomonas faeni]|uniref:hypothetical protein n=1 Tax=Sphingomonas faeni TaxID=185950 RepID=UPI00278404C9|nr:hypothetical protein [Sphingomonas faeni]MDQ0839307.1 hypothetical protein [Sphingomonas faeni]
MLMGNKTSLPSSSVLCVGLMTACIAVAPAAANQKLINEGVGPMDPILQYAEQMAPRNEFFLNSSDDVELVRFKQPHDLSICVARSTDRRPNAQAYPISVAWDGNVGTVTPGNCLTFDAQTVKVRPASRLPQDMELTGTIRVLR